MSVTVTAGVRLLLAGLLVMASAVPALTQEQRPDIRVSIPEENFRATPGGTLVAVVLNGAPLRGGSAQERWREVTLDAWIRAESVAATTRDGFDLAIARGGATLYLEPGGTAVARGLEGFLLDEVSRRDGWVRVRRTGWIWSPSLERISPDSAAGPTASPPARGDTATNGGGSPAPAAPRSLHRTPAGPALGTLAPEAPLEVLGREGEWARVRVEGWVRVPEGSELGPSAPMADLSLRAMRETPDLYRGRTVAWRVQFVAIQRADSLRSDFTAGEPYLLARDPDGEPGYVYIAVPEAMLPQARRLVPLQQVEVVARVRTGRSELMGHPVLDLVELRPVRTR